MNKDYQVVLKQINKFIAERNWSQFHNLKDFAIAISIESNELLEKFLWQKEAEIGPMLANKKMREEIEDEFADTFIYLLEFAQMANIDINRVCTAKLKKAALKYPVKDSKNSKLKYTKLELKRKAK